ncbi:3-(3-hydroxy-phenyl)propionate transporter MhpT [Pseudomonas huaxiensis]|uniref:3-(3-hydroxy-phenyl)propionate transporter MhpT n=1 Tax=Pseudomonas huaxiensis TaxID=2213017 RepID=UPI000DA6AE04|nr:3-(3-hydroxy-phenyl)propionate transporter MhpT [Pseudomonas huaxiensis]
MTVKTDKTKLLITIMLCFLVALMEGLDLQAPGIAAHGMSADYGLDKVDMGWVFSVGVLGMLPGAFVGGRLADRYGRKKVLIASVALFGVFSLVTTVAWSFSALLFARFLTGVGLGASLPNLIALASEAAGERMRGTAVSMMYCGVPLGAALAAAIGLLDLGVGWKLVFYVGGVVPLVIVPLLAFYLPDLYKPAQTGGATVELPSTKSILVENGSLKITLLLWVSFFFTLMVTYILINWLPSILIGQGFKPNEASMVVLSMQLGAAIGTLMLGVATDRLPIWVMSLLVYGGTLISLACLTSATALPAMMAAGFLAGIFTTGGQCVLYALAPQFYPANGRATGTGAAVAVGRIGAMTGPLVIGKMMALGAGTSGVMLASAPGLVLAAMSLLYLSSIKKGPAPTTSVA